MARTLNTPRAIVDGYRRTGNVPEWPLPAGLVDQAAVICREATGAGFADLAPEEIVRRYAGESLEEVADLYASACRYALGRPLAGIGIELGAGCGVLSALVAKAPRVEAMLAVEVVERVVKTLAPVTAKSILGSQVDKVVPIWGSFDQVELADASIDFAVEFHSLHHSDDLLTTLVELRRVLKPGAVVLAFDRVLPDWTSDEEIERRLSIEYGEDFLRRYNYPAGIRLTRRENGEHELRKSDWRRVALSAGFTVKRFLRFFRRRRWAALRTPRDLALKMIERARRHAFGQMPAMTSSTGFILEKPLS